MNGASEGQKRMIKQCSAHSTKLNQVKTQEQVNIKLDKTLDAIQKEREIDEKNKKENDKNIRDMKMWVLGLVGTIFGSLIIALLRMLMGI